VYTTTLAPAITANPSRTSKTVRVPNPPAGKNRRTGRARGAAICIAV
jgi:hypothetical protein